MAPHATTKEPHGINEYLKKNGTTRILEKFFYRFDIIFSPYFPPVQFISLLPRSLCPQEVGMDGVAAGGNTPHLSTSPSRPKYSKCQQAHVMELIKASCTYNPPATAKTITQTARINIVRDREKGVSMRQEISLCIGFANHGRRCPLGKRRFGCHI